VLITVITLDAAWASRAAVRPSRPEPAVGAVSPLRRVGRADPPTIGGARL